MGRAASKLLAGVLMSCSMSAAVAATAAHAVTGGRPASEPYPWMASLQLKREHFCGATLVRPGWALTAAHCIENRRPRDLSVVLGRTKLSTRNGERIGVRSLVEHAEYRTDPAGGHDIALLELERESAATPLRPVSRAESGLWAPGRPSRVIGWGTSVFLIGPPSENLMEVDVEMISDEDCALAGADGFDPSTQVCAGRRVVGLADSCQGDSGGPLVVRDGSGAWTQVGVVSQGIGCGFPLFYGIYARIGGPVLNEWIADRIGPPPAASGPGTPGPGDPGPGPGDPGPGSGGAGPGGPGGPGGPESGDGESAATPSDARLRNAGRLRRSRHGFLLRVSSDRRLTNLRVTLSRAGRTVARGRLPLLDRRGTVRLARRSPVRPGRLRVRLRATDAAGRTVKRSGTVRLPRGARR